MRKHWANIRINDVQVKAPLTGVYVGDEPAIETIVHLGDVAPEFVTVQAYFGEALNNEILKPATVDLAKVRKLDDSNYLYSGRIPASESGSYGVNVRVIPTHPSLTQAHELRLITWAK